MIKIEETEICGWRPATRGMRNPKNSWDKSDNIFWNDGSVETVSYTHLTLPTMAVV